MLLTWGRSLQQLIAAAVAVGGRVGVQQASVAALQPGGHAGRVPGSRRRWRARPVTSLAASFILATSTSSAWRPASVRR
jgi:hypothetical protein